MKNNSSSLYMLWATAILMLSPTAHAIIGCMDNSYHLEKEYDYKQYHYVECNCPCKAQRTRHNKCSECLHFYMPTNWTFSSARPSTATVDEQKSPRVSPSFATSEAVLKMWVNKYKGNNHE